MDRYYITKKCLGDLLNTVSFINNNNNISPVKPFGGSISLPICPCFWKISFSSFGSVFEGKFFTNIIVLDLLIFFC